MRDAYYSYYLVFASYVSRITYHVSQAKAELAGIHNTPWVERVFERVERGPGGAVLFAHQAAQLEADAVMLVEHAAVRQRGPRRRRPDAIVQLQRGLGVLRWGVDDEAVVDH